MKIKLNDSIINIFNIILSNNKQIKNFFSWFFEEVSSPEFTELKHSNVIFLLDRLITRFEGYSASQFNSIQIVENSDKLTIADREIKRYITQYLKNCLNLYIELDESDINDLPTKQTLSRIMNILDFFYQANVYFYSSLYKNDIYSLDHANMTNNLKRFIHMASRDNHRFTHSLDLIRNMLNLRYKVLVKNIFELDYPKIKDKIKVMNMIIEDLSKLLLISSNSVLKYGPAEITSSNTAFNFLKEAIERSITGFAVIKSKERYPSDFIIYLVHYKNNLFEFMQGNSVKEIDFKQSISKIGGSDQDLLSRLYLGKFIPDISILASRVISNNFSLGLFKNCLVFIPKEIELELRLMDKKDIPKIVTNEIANLKEIAVRFKCYTEINVEKLKIEEVESLKIGDNPKLRSSYFDKKLIDRSINNKCFLLTADSDFFLLNKYAQNILYFDSTTKLSLFIVNNFKELVQNSMEVLKSDLVVSIPDLNNNSFIEGNLIQSGKDILFKFKINCG